MDNSHSGRKVHYGLGAGANAASAAFWLRHSTLNFYDRQDHLDNESAMGVDERINDSEIASILADGSIEGKIGVDSIGLVLRGMFGAPTSVQRGTTGIYDHTFRFGATAGRVTAFRKSPMNDLKFGNATLSTLELRAAAKDWSMFSAEATALKGVTATSTPAYIEAEAEFSGKNVSVRVGTTEAAMLAATRLPATTANATISREVSPFFGLGNVEPDDIDATEIGVEGEVTLRYKNTDVETYWRNNTKLWLQIAHTNTAVDLGGGVNPSLVITYPKASLRTPDLSNDLAAIVKQTFNVIGEMNLTAGRAIEVVLTNRVVSYA